MANTTNLSGWLSHPDKPLEIHTGNVICLAEKFLSDLPGHYPELFHDLVKIMAFSHDIGKATSNFQQYIRGDHKLKNDPLTRHALLGAVISLDLAIHRLNNTDACHLEETEKCFYQALSFLIPKRHHGNLLDILDELSLPDEDFEALEKQLGAIDKAKAKLFTGHFKDCDFLPPDYDFTAINLDDLRCHLRKTKRGIRKLILKADDRGLQRYLQTILAFSLLLDADKSDVVLNAHFRIQDKDIGLGNDTVDRYVRKLKNVDGGINALRKQAYEEVRCFNAAPGKRIYSLTLPTGLGKTLLSFHAALSIINTLDNGRDYKIIYALPFLSIIEQNHAVIKAVLEVNDVDCDSSMLLKHHHFTDFSYRANENEYDYDVSRILIEGWQSKIIVTTFVQLFYTLLNNKNRSLRRFHNLANSVIILDEIQSIPHKYWKLINRLFIRLTEEFNCYIILTTATQPFIFKPGEYRNIITQPAQYYSQLNRYRISIDLQEKTLEDFADSLTLENDKSYLFIFNTVGSARKFYRLLKRKINEPVIYLSTHVVPCERLKRIRQLQAKETRIAVTTQLVEAGVDIDFDVVYRDFAPLDCLIQAAGRCNRSGLNTQGEVHVIRLNDPKHNKNYSQFIYDYILLDNTEKILNKAAYSENEVLGLIHSYYEKLNETTSQNESNRLLRGINRLKFYGEKDNEVIPISNFLLIEEDNYKRDVFVEIDDEAHKVWEKYIAIREEPSLFERRKKFDAIKSTFYQYVVSVPVKENMPQESHNFLYVENAILNDFYDMETGYIPEDDPSPPVL